MANAAKIAAQAQTHTTNAVASSCRLDDILANGTPEEILKHAKVLEAAGCYIRRALAKGAIGGPELSDDWVCSCPEGNAAGITEKECGCGNGGRG